VWDLGGQTSIRYGNVINDDIVGNGPVSGYLHNNVYLIVGILIFSAFNNEYFILRGILGSAACDLNSQCSGVGFHSIVLILVRSGLVLLKMVYVTGAQTIFYISFFSSFGLMVE
jgi:hypothetical protein